MEAKEKKTLEEWQIEDAKRLKDMLIKYMADKKISQAALMQKVDLSQGMYFQLLGGEGSPPKRPLSYEHVYAFAQLLKTTIDAISPTLASRLLEMASLVKNNDVYKRQIDFFYKNVSNDSRDLILQTAQKVFTEENPEVSIGNPWSGNDRRLQTRDSTILNGDISNTVPPGEIKNAAKTKPKISKVRR